MKRVVFLLGVFDRNTRRSGNPISDADYAIVDNVATKLGVTADIKFAVPSLEYAGEAKNVSMAALRAHRDAVLAEINEIKPDVVVACGTVALKCLLNKGNVTLKENLRATLLVSELDASIACVASQSMEMISANPGMDKWLMLDTHAALFGRINTEWGKYAILRPGTPEWSKMPTQLAKAKVVGLDLETYPGLDPWHPQARIRMAVISDQVGRAWLVQAKKNSGLPAWLTKIAADPTVVCGGSNIKYDFKWMERFGYTIENMHDTSTAEHVLDCTNPLTDLKSLTFIYCPKLGDYSKGHRDLVSERGGWEFVADDEMYQYTGGDGESSIAATKEQRRKLRDEGLMRPFELSMGLYRVLAGMEARGACISTQVNDQLHTEFDAGIATLRHELSEVLGPINPNSPDQLVDALMQAVPGINLRKPNLQRQIADTHYRLRTDSADDDYSTDKAVLEREAERHPIIRTLLQYRRYSKLQSTYVTGLREKHMVLHPDQQHYVHTSYRTDVVETYRLSSQGPNLQNIPRKPEPDEPNPIPLHLNIKRQFVSRWPGGKILEADLSQAEIRIAAELSSDRDMLDAIESGDDLHTALTARFHGKRPEDVTKLERTHGKRQTFLVLYGGGANTLSRQIGVTKEQAKEMLAQYFRTFKGLDKYIQKVRYDVKRDLYSESIFGYRRRFRKPTDWNTYDGWRIERQAWNHQVQNGAACITFAAMIDLQRALKQHRLKSVIVMQVHDSIVVDCFPGEEDKVARLAKTCLEHPDLDRWGVKLRVPLVADIEIGPSWGEKEAVEQG